MGSVVVCLTLKGLPMSSSPLSAQCRCDTPWGSCYDSETTPDTSRDHIWHYSTHTITLMTCLDFCRHTKSRRWHILTDYSGSDQISSSNCLVLNTAHVPSVQRHYIWTQIAHPRSVASVICTRTRAPSDTCPKRRVAYRIWRLTQ